MKKIIILLIIIFIIAFNGIAIFNRVDNQRIQDAKEFCSKHNLNSDICIFVDFSKPRILKRLYIYDLKNNKIIHSSLCPTGLAKNKFSNIPGSYLSSLGKYKVTGTKYKLKNGYEGLIIQGLQSSNSNAERRKILVHYSKYVNVFSMYSRKLSYGCFVTNKGTYNKIKTLDKPLLLWAYK